MGHSADGAMSAFGRAWAFTSRWEGGFVDNPDDPGGRTNLGITQATYTSWLGEPRDVKDITPTEAEAIAKSEYWDAMGLDGFSPDMAMALFDWGFHSGAVNVMRRTADMTSVKQVMDARMDFLVGLTNFNHFGRGWVRRVEALRRELSRDITNLDVEVVQVFNDEGLLASFYPRAVSVGTTNSGRAKVMVRF